MAITAAGMYSRYQTAIASIGQTSNAATAQAAADTIMLALFAAVVDEIHANAHATGTDTRGDSHNLVIS